MILKFTVDEEKPHAREVNKVQLDGEKPQNLVIRESKGKVSV